MRELLRQPHTPLSSGGRLRLRCPLRQGRPRRRGRVGPHPRTPGRDRAAAGLLGTTAADEQRSRNVAESTSGCASWPQRRSPTSNWATTSASPMSTTPSPFMAKRRGPKCMWRNAALRGHRTGPRLATFMRKGSPTGVRQRPVHRRERTLLPDGPTRATLTFPEVGSARSSGQCDWSRNRGGPLVQNYGRLSADTVPPTPVEP